MNHYAARELQQEGRPTGLWHYTCENNGRIWPVGHCSWFRTCPECDGRLGSATCSTCQDQGCILVEPRDRCPGHTSAEEACEHYRQSLLDRASFTARADVGSWPKRKCENKECSREATHVARVPGSHYIRHDFCETHCVREELSKLVTVGECWSS